MKVLFVDDDPDDLVAVADMLLAYLPGCELATASSGEAGIETARTFQPDTILLDILMPGMDGFAVCRVLKDDPATRHIPVVFLTGYGTDPASRIRGLEIGGDAFLTKPVEPGELMAQVRAMVRIKQAEDALRGEKYALERIVAERTAALRASEKRLNLALETNRTGVWDLDLVDHTAHRTLLHDRIFGYDTLLPSWTYEMFLEHVLPEDRPDVDRSFREATEAQSDWSFECRIRRIDGEVRWIRGSGGHESNSEGQPKRMSGLVQDITEHKRADEALRASEDKYRQLVESVSDVIFEVDARGSLVYLSPAIRQVLGYEPETLLGRGFLEFVHPEDRGFLIRRFSEGAQGIEAPSEYRILARTGEARWVRTRTKPILIGGVFSGARGTLIDTTERKRAEEALKESEKRYRQLFERNLAGVYRTTLDGRFLDCNDAFARMYGFGSREEALQHDAVDCHVNPEARQAFIAELRVEGTLVNSESQGRRRDGRLIWLLENSSLVPDESGCLTEIEGTLVDITERKRLEAQLLEAQKMETVGRLAGGVAHDFNNILQAMLSQAEALQLGASTPELAEAAAEIEAYIRRGASLTQQLLLFSRRHVSQRKRFDLNEVVSASGEMLRRVIPENIRLAVETAPGGLWVEGDAGQLQQALVNLALNARDAMPSGGALTVRADRGEDEVVVEVADTGHGMDEETRAHLFEPFFTTKEAGNGTGLGLAVVHGIVHQHGGRVEVRSRPGEGSRFRVVLPAAPAQPAAAGGAAQAGTELPRGHGERVLVVEDEEGARKGMVKILTLLGYQVTAVGSGEEALALEEAPGFDLLLSDLMLPGIPGSELAERLGERWPTLKVVLMSGYTEDMAVRRGVEQRAVRFLQKPFDMAALAREVRGALEDAG